MLLADDQTPTLSPLAEADPADLASLNPSGGRWRRWGAAAALALALGLGLWARSGPTDPQAQWLIEAPRSADLVTTVTAVGQLAPLDSVEVSSELSGTVLEVLVEANQEVRAGQVLARLDPTTFETSADQQRAQLASAQASVRQAQVQLESAERELGRAQRLLSRGAATAVEVENAAAAVDSARASLGVARAQRDQASSGVARAERDRGRTEITSPIDGVVTQRMVEPGQTVVSAMSVTPLFTIASDLDRLSVEVAVDEADIGRVAEGQQVSFTVPGWPDRSFSATVHRIALAPSPTSQVVSYATELRIDNALGLLRPGMTATAAIEVDRLPDALQVPARALRFEPPQEQAFGPPRPRPQRDGDRVWVIDEAGAPLEIPVDVVGSDGQWSAVQPLEGHLDVDSALLVGSRS